MMICPHNPHRESEAAPTLRLASLAEDFRPVLKMAETNANENGFIRVPSGYELERSEKLEVWRDAQAL